MSRSQICVTLAAATLFMAAGAPAAAQSFEVTPFTGFRGGGLDVETFGDRDTRGGTPAVGVIVDVPLSAGLQFEAAFSHQKTGALTTDHWQAGGLQEYFGGRLRPFLTGILGLTRYETGGDNEVRFTAGAGTGVKMFPSSRIGVRFDGRVFATFLDVQGSAVACVNTCFIAIQHLDVAWQAEFTAGLVLRLH